MPVYRIPIEGFVVLALASFAVYRLALKPARLPWIKRLIGLYAVGQTALTGWVFHSHLWFPMNLEFMESTVLQHVLRLSSGLAVYVDPSPQFVPLAYNPLFYLVCVPFVRLFGANLTAIRLPAILGAVGAALMLYLIVRRHAKSRWWAGVAVGLYAAAYRTMDCYLDIGHRDSLLVLSILAGFWCLDGGGRVKPYVGIACLAAGFWFKQQGALFLVLGMIHVCWRYPWRQALSVSLIGLALAPILYIFSESWWGVRLHYFTYQVPRQWAEFRWNEFLYVVRLLFWHYGALVAAAGWLWWKTLFRTAGPSLGILRIALPGALLSGFAAAMTPGSNNNVFIPMGCLLIAGGVVALSRLGKMPGTGRQYGYALLMLAFAPMLYYPSTVLLTPSDATAAFADFTRMLSALDGSVYGPGLGPVPVPAGAHIRQTPLAHLVPMADMVRGPGRDEHAHAAVRALLESVENPDGRAYIIGHAPLLTEPTLAYLEPRYTLVADFGRRFEALATLPARHGHLYPRYLYRSNPPPGGPPTLAKGNR